jgi:hypothetical protein
MNVRFNVAELVRVVAKTLSSIDVRTASVLIEGKWQNVMTVVVVRQPKRASAG